LARRPDLKIDFLRGNVGTRLSKLDAGDYQAILLASAGLIRLKLSERIRHSIDPDWLLPAVGQGAVGIETREGDARIIELLKPLHHEQTALRVLAERAMNRKLNGGCQVPIGGYATLNGSGITLEGRVGSVDGKTLLKVTKAVDLAGDYAQRVTAVETLGNQVADQLLAQGAADILADL